MLSTYTVSKRLNVPRRTLYDWLRLGKFPNAVKLSPKCWRIPASDVEAMLRPVR